MARIELNNVTVEYPIYNARSMSLRNRLVAIGTGGTLARGANKLVTVRALENVSFSIAEGDRVGLVGHNGSGKSTRLRTLAGIDEPTQGTVSVVGKIATILQLGAGLDLELSGYENIVRMGMLLGATMAEARAFIPDIEAFTELGEFTE